MRRTGRDRTKIKGEKERESERKRLSEDVADQMKGETDEV